MHGKNRRPVIGITPSVTEDGFIRMRPAYLDAVWRAGGMPVYVAYTSEPDKLDEYADAFDGFLFAGGVDLDPKYYGESVAFDSVEICPARDDFELALFERVIKSGKPVLGICRGIQLLNVAMGGSLHQHIEGHSQREGVAVRTQKTEILPSTPLSDILGGTRPLEVNSFHHQAVKDIAPELRSAAFAADGICEAIYLPGHRFFLGVQWHPELLTGPDAEALFSALVAGCGGGSV